MKKILPIIFSVFLTIQAYAQSPDSFNYQAVIRDGAGEILSEQAIGVRMTILQGSATGSVVFRETFSQSTTSFGLLNLKIGTGSTVSGDFSTIDWSNGPYFVETSIDITGGTSYQVLGASQLLSVPFALYAKNSGSSVPGPQGEAGADGRTVLSGFGVPLSEGEDGDFYINTSTSEIYGPKTSGSWGSPTSLVGVAGADGHDGTDGQDGANGADGTNGTNGADGANGTNGTDGVNGADGADGQNGKTIVSGTSSPTTEGVDGDFYINTTTSEIYGPKTGGVWGAATSLVGAEGSDGADGNNGHTVLNGAVAPTTEGVDGDFYINTTANEIHGPKTGGVWGAATSLVGAAGSDGADGNDGQTILNGSVAPTTEGVDGDFYINTSTGEIHGPKTGGAWGTATSLVGAAGSDGADGSDGQTILNGSEAPTTEGVDGDFYINTATSEIYGPKTGGAWGAATPLVGAQGPQGPAGSGGGTAATYRWATFHSYSNNLNQWAFNNDPNMFGGVTPQVWTDASGIASQMSSDKEVLRTLFQHKGYATKNAMIINDEYSSFSSTNGKVAMVLMRIRNNTASPILWSPDIMYSAYSNWGEKASAALNGTTVMNESTTGSRVLTDLVIPANRTSTFIVVATSSPPSVGENMRLCRLGFISDTLELPAGLEFVDDLDTASGGWEQ
ncbi:MAG: hypothetical protein ABJG78_05330 [Cyclobacteriaceae bacterium]